MSETKSCRFCRDWDEDRITDNIIEGSIRVLPDFCGQNSGTIELSSFINRKRALEVYLCTDDDGYMTFESEQLNYCPFCGRSLKNPLLK
jgi:hypothetical protein